MNFNFGSFCLGFFVAFLLSTVLTVAEAVIKNLKYRKNSEKENKKDE